MVDILENAFTFVFENDARYISISLDEYCSYLFFEGKCHMFAGVIINRMKMNVSISMLSPDH